MPEKKRNKRSPKNPLDYQVCIKCDKEKRLSSDYYSTESELYSKTKKYPVCKECLTANLPPADPDNIEYTNGIKNILREINKPFIVQTWQSSIEESQRRNWDVFGCYMKNLALLSKSATSKETDNFIAPLTIESTAPEIVQQSIKKEIEITEIDKKNEEDVLRMLGYDPFESENKKDKKFLYNRLVDFLDESTLEDSFKLPAVIEIAISFKQIDKINNAISKITENEETIASEVGKLSSLITAKEKMLKSVLALAKDNGISVNHNNNKSKGAGTLSGIIKQLHEKGIGAAEINIYDIETCEGMQQVANISNRSIMEQLMLNENDYTEMIKDQRDMIISLTGKFESLEEENRLLKVQLKFAQIEERKAKTFIEGETS